MQLGVVIHLFWEEEVLLILRDDLKGVVDRNKWDSVTETMEPEDGGDFEATMRRGLLEEIGIVPKRIHFLGLTRQSGHGFFCGFMTKEEVAAIEFGPEGQDFRFYSLEQARKLELGSALRNYLEAYPEAFQKMAAGLLPTPQELRPQPVPAREAC